MIKHKERRKRQVKYGESKRVKAGLDQKAKEKSVKEIEEEQTDRNQDS